MTFFGRRVAAAASSFQPGHAYAYWESLQGDDGDNEGSVVEQFAYAVFTSPLTAPMVW